MNKTNVMRILDKAKITYDAFEYSKEYTEGIIIADALSEDRKVVFKTLVTVSNNSQNYVFVIPVAETLDLKAAAAAVKTKSISMLKQKDLLPLTGYVHGGCSPIGMKKQFVTVIDSSAKDLPFFFISGGKIGHQIKVNPIDLSNVINAVFSDICLKSGSIPYFV